MKGKLCVWRAQNCITVVGVENALTSVGPKNTLLHGGRYRSDDGKAQNLMHPNPNGTEFTPKQWLYQREATCMESSKLYCPRRCRKRTYQCYTGKNLATLGAV